MVDTIHRPEAFPLKEFRGDIEANLVAQFAVAQAAFPVLLKGASRRSCCSLFGPAETGRLIRPAMPRPRSSARCFTCWARSLSGIRASSPQAANSATG